MTSPLWFLCGLALGGTLTAFVVCYAWFRESQTSKREHASELSHTWTNYWMRQARSPHPLGHAISNQNAGEFLASVRQFKED